MTIQNTSTSKNVKIFRNFATAEECKILSEIALQGLKDGWFSQGLDKKDKDPSKFDQIKNLVKTDKRYTTRFNENNIEHPQFVKDMQSKIRKFVGIDHFPLIEGLGKDGVVISISYEGGDVYPHRDPRSNGNDFITYRCNIMTSAAEGGGQLMIEGEPIDINAGDLHCYAVSELTHQVSPFEGTTPRIMYMFGAAIPEEEINSF
jgi:hypothetical protein